MRVNQDSMGVFLFGLLMITIGAGFAAGWPGFFIAGGLGLVVSATSRSA